MVRSLWPEVTQELIKDVVHIQHLFTLELTSATYRWTEGANSIYYGGYWYLSKQIKFENAGITLTSQIDSITLFIANVTKTISDIILSEDVRNKEVIIQRVLLDRNLYVVGSPATVFVGFIDRIRVDRKEARIEIFNHMIRWKTQTPKRLHPPTCPWIFKGIECAYNGILIANPASDTSVEFTRSAGTLNWQNVNDYLGCLVGGQTYLADSEYGGAYLASYGFDENLTTKWASTDTAFPHWLRVQYSTAKIINKYAITARESPNEVATPKNWIFQGSNDGTNWIDLDVRTGVTGWSGYQQIAFDFDNTTAYIYYRLYITLNQSGDLSSFLELCLFGPSDQINDEDYNYASGNTDLCVGGTPSVDSYYSTYSGVYAFDDNSATYWQATSAWPHWLRYQLTAAKTAVLYTIRAGTGGSETQAPKDFKLQGSNNSTDWTDLDNRTGVTFSSGERKFFAPTSTGSYLYYRILVTANNDGTYPTYCLIAEMELFETYSMTDLFGLPTISVASDVTNIVVTVRVRAKQTTTSARNLAGIIKIGGNIYLASAITPATSFIDYDFVWLTNPNTGVAWTVANIGVIQGIGYSVPADAGGNRVDVSECYLKVSNDIDDLTCDYTPERCEELNNRLNFGGFKYMPELAVKEFWWGAKQKVWTGPY